MLCFEKIAVSCKEDAVFLLLCYYKLNGYNWCLILFQGLWSVFSMGSFSSTILFVWACTSVLIRSGQNTDSRFLMPDRQPLVFNLTCLVLKHRRLPHCCGNEALVQITITLGDKWFLYFWFVKPPPLHPTFSFFTLFVFSVGLWREKKAKKRKESLHSCFLFFCLITEIYIL